ncbi:MAG: RHS repeat-associated core domain-containing protein [Pirellulales bacterium]
MKYGFFFSDTTRTDKRRSYSVLLSASAREPGIHYREAYVYDGQNLVLQYWGYGSGSLASSTLNHGFLYGPAVDEILADQTTVYGAGWDVRWPLADNLGTIRDSVKFTPASGGNDDITEIVDHLCYDTFGNITSQTNPAEQPRFTYTARELDSDTGLYYYRARWYDAATGKFMSEDPIDFRGGDENLYRYVGNGAVNAADPSGELPPSKWQPDTPYVLTANPLAIHEDHWGAFRAKIQWKVSPAPLEAPKSERLPSTSLVIQHVVASFDIRDAKTGQRTAIPDWNYWEAWTVPPGSVSPPSLPGRAVDDMFWITPSDVRRGTCGTIVIRGTAQFYPNTSLPSDFRPRNPATHAHDLPSTTNGGAMDGLQPRSFPPVIHLVVAEWTTDQRGKTHVTSSISRGAPEPWPPGPIV